MILHFKQHLDGITLNRDYGTKLQRRQGRHYSIERSLNIFLSKYPAKYIYETSIQKPRLILRNLNENVIRISMIWDVKEAWSEREREVQHKYTDVNRYRETLKENLL